MSTGLIIGVCSVVGVVVLFIWLVKYGTKRAEKNAMLEEINNQQEAQIELQKKINKLSNAAPADVDFGKLLKNRRK